MNDAFGVGGIQRVGNLDSQFQDVFHRQRLARYAVLQRLTVEKLHRDKRSAIFFADVVNRANVGVIQC